MKLNIILPSAGKGTRLNLPYPKEILRLDSDSALIDNCFNFSGDIENFESTEFNLLLSLKCFSTATIPRGIEAIVDSIPIV